MLLDRCQTKPLWTTLLCIAGLWTTSDQRACAQVPPQLPPTDAPSRIEQEFQTPAPPQSQPDLRVPSRPELTPPPGAEAQQFRLVSLEIQGVTVYSTEELQALYRDFLGKAITLSQLYEIANRITQRYRQDGYVLSRAVVPAQSIQNGVAQLQVIEGFIDQVNFEGAPSRQLNRLRGFGDKLMTARPLNIKQLERYLLLAGDLAGLKVRGILSPGSELGAVTLTIVANYDAVDGYVNFNNRGSDTVGPLRLQTAVLLNSLMGQGERLTLSGSTTPNDISQLGNGSLLLSFPIGFEGLQLNLGGSYTAIRPGNDLRRFDINGNTTTATARISYPLIRARQLNLDVSGGFDYLNEKITTLFTGTEEFLSEDRLRVLRFGLASNMTDATGITSASARLSVGLGGLGATTEGTAQRPLSRALGNASFTKLNVELARQQFLPVGFTLVLAGTTQITSTALLVPEQFGLGGAEFGRVFNPSAALGDSGYGLRAELQRSFFYPNSRGTPWVTQPYAFVDYGQVFRIFPTAAEPGQSTIGSTGFGVRQSLSNKFVLQLEAAFPLIQENVLKEEGMRVFFAVEGFF